MGFSLQSNGKGGYPSGGTLTLYHHLPTIYDIGYSPKGTHIFLVIQGLYEFFFCNGG